MTTNRYTPRSPHFRSSLGLPDQPQINGERIKARETANPSLPPDWEMPDEMPAPPPAIKVIQRELSKYNRLHEGAKDNTEIGRLAGLSKLEYERQRKEAAKKLGVRTSELDKAVREEQSKTAPSEGQGKVFELQELQSWPEAVNGVELLSETVAVIQRYLVLPDGSAEILAVWALHTHCYDCFAISPRLATPWWPKIDVPDDIDSKSVRQKLGITQARLAAMLGVSVRVVEGWERIRWAKAAPDENTDKWGGGEWRDRECRPSAAARVLLALIDRDPWIVHDILCGQMKRRTRAAPRLTDSLDTDFAALRRAGFFDGI